MPRGGNIRRSVEDIKHNIDHEDFEEIICNNSISLRNRAVLALLYLTAARVGELFPQQQHQYTRMKKEKYQVLNPDTNELENKERFIQVAAVSGYDSMGIDITQLNLHFDESGNLEPVTYWHNGKEFWDIKNVFTEKRRNEKRELRRNIPVPVEEDRNMICVILDYVTLFYKTHGKFHDPSNDTRRIFSELSRSQVYKIVQNFCKYYPELETSDSWWLHAIRSHRLRWLKGIGLSNEHLQMVANWADTRPASTYTKPLRENLLDAFTQ